MCKLYVVVHRTLHVYSKMPIHRRVIYEDSRNVSSDGQIGKEKHVASNDIVVKRASGTSSWRYIKMAVLLCVCVYLLIPVFAMLLPLVAKQFLYLNLIKNPFYGNYQKPENENMTGTRNVHINAIPPSDGITLGLWHILPHSAHTDTIPIEDEVFNSALKDDKPVILYLHGNAGTRAANHRLLLYKLLSEMDFHVVALDYRGFGDSSGWPTAEGVVIDAESAYRWIRERSSQAPVYVWGHSMGSGIGSAMVRRLCKTGSCPEGLILEAPYNSMQDAMRNHPFTVPWWYIPGSLELISMAYAQEEHMFDTQENLKEVLCPVMIVHAEDDMVVPYKLGKRLHDYVREHRDKSLPPVTFHSFGNTGCGHRHIVDSPLLPEIIRQFVK